MAEKKRVYLHFERGEYLKGKTDLLKFQMEVLYLKKLIKNLSITRMKKKEYLITLLASLSDLNNKVKKLDFYLPSDEETSKVGIAKKGDLRKKGAIPKKISLEKRDEIEEELREIREKLAFLNSASA